MYVSTPPLNGAKYLPMCRTLKGQVAGVGKPAFYPPPAPRYTALPRTWRAPAAGRLAGAAEALLQGAEAVLEPALPELLETAVYGLPEINRDNIRDARLVANPGCYPTATILGFLPLVEQGLVDASTLVADCKSGVSGAGRGASVPALMAECGESFKAYGVPGMRECKTILRDAGFARVDVHPLTFGIATIHLATR